MGELLRSVEPTFKISVALRVARAAMGWSQDEMARELGMAKTTLARAETAEGNLSAVQLSQILTLYAANGIDIQFMVGNDLTLKINDSGLRKAQAKLIDASTRRSDRAKPIGIINRAMAQADAPDGILSGIVREGKSDT